VWNTPVKQKVGEMARTEDYARISALRFTVDVVCRQGLLGILALVQIGIDYVSQFVFSISDKIADPILLLNGLAIQDCPNFDNLATIAAIFIDTERFVNDPFSKFRANRHV
jgi:hypothetical protein